jgi:hypothetical protein
MLKPTSTSRQRGGAGQVVLDPPPGLWCAGTDQRAGMTKRMGGHQQMIGRFATVALCLATVDYLAVGTSGAVAVRHSSSGTSFSVTGTGTGTLKPGPHAFCLNNLVKKNGLTDVCGLMGKITGFSQGGASWSLEVSEKKIGNFRLSGSPIIDPHVILQPSATTISGYSKIVTADTFFSKSGTVTLAAKSGSIPASMATFGGKTISIIGSWHCKA